MDLFIVPTIDGDILGRPFDQTERARIAEEAL